MVIIKNLMHNDSLQLFNEKIFEGILDIENVISKKKSITVDGEKFYGFFMEKDKETYFLQDIPGDKSVLDVMPIIVADKFETDYSKLVFWFINKYKSVKIPDEKKISFKEVVDTIAGFNHTNPQHWLLYKIITIAARCDRINYRVVAARGFGKDSVINNIKDLVGSTANIYGATFAKLEYSLINKLIIFNEMGNLKAEDKYNLQQFLLAIGAFFNKYTKRSRATESTQEEYDLSKQSLGIIYNPPQYYIERGQEWFDTMFQKAVPNRFLPFYLDGKLDEKFASEFDTEKVVKDNIEIYKNIISTLRYYKNTTISNKYDLPDDIVFDKDTRRFERSFLKIVDYISEYAGDDEKTFYELTYELYKAYEEFNKILEDALQQVED